jgi:hypothetical protein
LTLPKSISETRQKVYAFAVEGKAAVDIARLLTISRPMVSRHLKRLCENDFLTRLSSNQYIKGENGKVLDAIIVNRSTVGYVNGGTLSPEGTNSAQIGSYCGVHHFEVCAQVTVESLDISVLEIKGASGYERKPFLTRKSQMRGWIQYFTAEPIVIGGRPYSFKYQVYPNGVSKLYTWLDGILTKAEMEVLGEAALEKLAQDRGQEPFNYVQKHGGWRLGLVHYTGGKTPHTMPEGPGMDAIRNAVGQGEGFEGRRLSFDYTPPRADGLMTGESHTIADTVAIQSCADHLPEIELAARSGSYGVYLLQRRVSEIDEYMKNQTKLIVEQDQRIERLEASIPRKPKEGEGREIA